MKDPFTILIADRNRHVRDFLRREMVAEGYRVQVANSGREVLKLACRKEDFDLLILDLDLPDAGELDVLEELRKCIPTLPVVVHTFLSEHVNRPPVVSMTAFVEKKGTNIDSLKEVVMDMLHKCYPKRFEHRGDIGARPAENRYDLE